MPIEGRHIAIKEEEPEGKNENKNGAISGKEPESCT
jgi:hypothetical protein